MIVHVDEETAQRIEALAARIEIEPEKVLGAALSLTEWYLGIHEGGEQVLVARADQSAYYPRLELVHMNADGVGRPLKLLPSERQ